MASLISSLRCVPLVDNCHPELVHPLSVLSEPYAEHLVYTRGSVSQMSASLFLELKAALQLPTQLPQFLAVE